MNYTNVYKKYRCFWNSYHGNRKKGVLFIENAKNLYQQVNKLIASKSKLAGGKVHKNNFPRKSKFVVAGENVIPDLLFYPLI